MRTGVALQLLLLGIGAPFSVCAQDPELLRAAQLDSEHKCDEAEQLYQVALKKGPPGVALLNNFGNHYLFCERPEKAAPYFERVLKINPDHQNANVQLARLAASHKDGVKALAYLSRVKDSDAIVQFVRIEALQLTGKRDAAIALANDVEKTAAGDPRLLFALGTACGRAGLYEQSEAAFNAVLSQVPDDYDVLYNLGLAAARAEHYDRARKAFEVALKIKPNDVDSLFELGRAESNSGNYIHAVYLLDSARTLAPQRTDVLLALARATQGAGFYGDSDLAYSEYLKLRPQDDMVRRDRALVHGFSETGRPEAMRDLTSYVQQHPRDAVAFFDLAQLAYHADRQQALAYASTAVRLDPALEPAHYIRAWLLHRLGHDEEALADLQIAVRLNPRDAMAFDQLGLTYMDLDKSSEAEDAFRRAVALSPDEPKILMHLARLLTDTGHPEEAEPFINRFRKAQPDGSQRPREEQVIIGPAGLSSTERAQRTLELLRQRVKANPGDQSLKLNLGGLLLLEGSTGEAAAVFRELLTLRPTATVSFKAGTRLLAAEQYALACDFLERASAEIPAAHLDLAMGLFFLRGADAALKSLEQVPSGVDAGDCMLLRAKILDSSGQHSEADKAIDESMHLVISRPQLAQESALLLARHQQGGKALSVIGQALKSAPDNPDLMLARVIVLASLNRTNDAEKGVKELEGRWPEWDRPYVIEGHLLEREGRVDEAQRRIGIAIALGTRDPAAICAQTRMAASGTTSNECLCQQSFLLPLLSDCQK